MTNPHAVALGRLGRARNTAAQKAAARRNGAKGGRPPLPHPSKSTLAQRKRRKSLHPNKGRTA